MTLCAVYKLRACASGKSQRAGAHMSKCRSKNRPTSAVKSVVGRNFAIYKQRKHEKLLLCLRACGLVPRAARGGDR